jgi:hypothetical protein
MYGVCLPLAVLIGYVLAEPLDSASMAVVTLVICVLSVPLVMRWHYPLLVFSCNAWIVFFFLPGRPPLWMGFAFASLSLSLINRSLGQNLRFFQARAVSYSLLALALVTLVTAFMNDGIGFRFLGGSNYGGKKYAFLFGSIMVYFALVARPIPRNRAYFYIGLFFLSTLIPFISYLGQYGGPAFNFLAELFPLQSSLQSLENNDFVGGNIGGNDPINRLTDLAEIGKGILCYVLARHGVRGLLDLRRPWRLGIFLAALVASLYSGFRSSLILFLLTFAVMFWLERLYRTRYMAMLIGVIILGAAVLVPNVTKLPPSVQRALSFLPINVDPVAKEDAKGSTTWRVEMWKELLPDVPKYLIKGRGYSLNPDDIFLVSQAARMGHASSYEFAMVTGDYHSGPLSVIIPLGLWGVVAFLWFLGASLHVLYRNYRYGDPYLYRINVLLFAYFIVQTFLFFVVFGSLHSDLLVFAGLVGMSVSLNDGVAKPKPEEPEPLPEEEAEPAY